MAKKHSVKKTQHHTSPPKAADSAIAAAPRFSREDQISWFLLTMLLFLVYTIRFKFLSIPFERDEGIYSYFGIMVLEGKVPYKDFYEFKFPGLFYFYALIVKLFGETVEGMHTGFNIVNLITIVLIYFAGRNLFSPFAGIISATTFALVSMTANASGFTVQAEHGVALFTAVGLLFYSLARKNGHWLYYLFMGAGMGMAVMVKSTGIFLPLWGGVIIITDFLFGAKPKVFSQLVKTMISYAAGGIAVTALFFTIILVQGSVNEMIYWVFEYSSAYGSMVSFEDGMKYFGYTRDAIVENYKFFWVHSLLAVGVCLFPQISYRLKAFAVTLLAFSFLTIVPGFFFYGHYWIQIIPGLALVSGLTFHGIMTIIESKRKDRKPTLRYAYLAIFALFTFSHINAMKSYYFHPNYELILRKVYGANPFPESMEIARYINANAKPEDQIVLLGSEPQIYFYTKKRAPSRHAYFTALVTNVPEHKEWQREFVKDTEAAKPRYIVFFNHSISLMVQPNTDNYVFEWANKYITEGYKVVGVVDMNNGMQSTYVWDPQQVNTYKPTGQYVIYVFERLPEAPQQTDSLNN